MTAVLTLVAADPVLDADYVRAVLSFLADQNVQATENPVWLSPGTAIDIPLISGLAVEPQDRLQRRLAEDRVDFFVTAPEGRRKTLLVADMDSTIIPHETLTEIAAAAGVGPAVEEITERAMRGEIDFGDSLRERLALLQGKPASLLTEKRDEITLNPGAATLVNTMRKHGAHCVLVSGGFTVFTSYVAKKAGFHSHHGNEILIEDDILTGKAKDPILDRHAKASILIQCQKDQGIERDEIMAIGDGANDLDMLAAAGLGIGYRPKPLLRENLTNHILHGDLTAALYAQGFHKEEFDGEEFDE